MRVRSLVALPLATLTVTDHPLPPLERAHMEEGPNRRTARRGVDLDRGVPAIPKAEAVAPPPVELVTEQGAGQRQVVNIVAVAAAVCGIERDALERDARIGSHRVLAHRLQLCPLAT